MKNLTISKEDLKNFEVGKIKDFSGCPEALKFLRKKFGNRVDDLSKCKEETLQVASIRPDWVIHFMFSLMNQDSRVEFVRSMFIEARDKELYPESVAHFFDKVTLRSFKEMALRGLDRDKTIEDIEVCEDFSTKPHLASLALTLKTIEKDQCITPRTGLSLIQNLAEAKTYLCSWGYAYYINDYATKIVEASGVFNEQN